MLWFKKKQKKTEKKLRVIENPDFIAIELPQIPNERILSATEMSKKLQQLWLEEVGGNKNQPIKKGLR